MSSFWTRVSFRPDGPVVGRSGVAVAAVIERLEAGERWDGLVQAIGLEPADILAALAAEGLGDDGSPGLPLIRSEPRRPRLLGALSELAISAGPKADRAARLALAAGLLQVHDFWDASHVAAQAADDLGERGTSAYWHGIAHRREPDAGNAAYWFRRVGRHPVFGPLAEAARPLIEAEGPAPWLARFERPDGWNPVALIELGSASSPGDRREALARRLQRIEMRLLLEASAAGVGLG